MDLRFWALVMTAWIFLNSDWTEAKGGPFGRIFIWPKGRWRIQVAWISAISSSIIASSIWISWISWDRACWVLAEPVNEGDKGSEELMARERRRLRMAEGRQSPSQATVASSWAGTDLGMRRRVTSLGRIGTVLVRL